MKLRIEYHRPQDLLADYEQQFQRGGVLVRVEPTPDLQLFSTVGLVLQTPYGTVELEANVIQILPGAGVAVGFDPKAAPALTRAVDQARAAGTSNGPPPTHHSDADATADEPRAAALARAAAAARAEADSGPAQVVDIHTRIRTASHHEKIQIALHGSREERALLIRDPTAQPLHVYVLKNPHLQLDEIAAIAGLRTVSPETLKMIANRREWAQRPDIAAALVRNPKTPVPVAMKLVPFLSQTELRQLAKVGNLRAPILKAVRKKVLN